MCPEELKYKEEDISHVVNNISERMLLLCVINSMMNVRFITLIINSVLALQY